MTFNPDAFNKSETCRILQGEKGNWYQEADDAGRQELRAWVYSVLQEAQAQIEFTKADGTHRSMT